ncbi:MAG: response regulator [Candidatus Lernaella stagnicola]|nr:response regulator [Candidatus Lernaella stagnicola]
MPAILIIDDDPQMAEVLLQYLDLAGYDDVVTATDAKEAVHWCETRKFDLIVTDILMPDMDGMEVILKLRVDQKVDTPIIAISGGGKFNRAAEVLNWAKHLGISCTLSKPIDRREFITKVTELLGDKRTS